MSNKIQEKLMNIINQKMHNLHILFVAIVVMFSLSPLPSEQLLADTKNMDTAIIEEKILRLVNIERQSRKLPPLLNDERLAEIALMHSKNILEKNFVSHRGTDGLYPQGRMLKYYPEVIGGSGENVAYHYGDTEKIAAENLMNAWMESPGHRANILSSDYNFIGIGVKQNGKYFYATQLFFESIVKIPSNTRQEYNYEDEAAIKFEFTGFFDKKNLTIFCVFADSKMRHLLPDGRFYTGVAPVTPQWIDEKNFTINFKFDKGKGKYKFRFGKNDRTFSDGFQVFVK